MANLGCEDAAGGVRSVLPSQTVTLPGPTWASQAVTKPVPNLLCEISARLLHANSIILILARTRACQPLDRLLKGSLDL